MNREEILREIESLQYEIDNNAISRIGQDRFSIINKKLGALKMQRKILDLVEKRINVLEELKKYELNNKMYARFQETQRMILNFRFLYKKIEKI